MAETRALSIELKPKSGGFVKFLAFINGHLIIAADAKGGSFEADVPVAELRLKVRVFGIDDAHYTLGIDLPGTANDQELTLQLSQGYNELELRI
jgi:hypothetical protein